MSERDVACRIYVEPARKAARPYHGFAQAMRWDETFGREYDLDIFMIVAVSDFNMGAMENKGLNVFNDKYVLASPETGPTPTGADRSGDRARDISTTWTGNRITCRDWFSAFASRKASRFPRSGILCHALAGGKADLDVRNLRATQFIEDSGPLAHPVRPELYKENQQFLYDDDLRGKNKVVAAGAHFDPGRKNSA